MKKVNIRLVFSHEEPEFPRKILDVSINTSNTKLIWFMPRMWKIAGKIAGIKSCEKCQLQNEEL